MSGTGSTDSNSESERIGNDIVTSGSFRYKPNTLIEFEKNFDAYKPEKGEIPVKMLGYGEISFVFTIDDSVHSDIAFKRLPIFSNVDQTASFIKSYKEYEDLLRDRIGLKVPEQDSFWCYGFNKKMEKVQNKITLFCMQKKINPQHVCNKLLHTLSNNDIFRLITAICNEIFKVFRFNLENHLEHIKHLFKSKGDNGGEELSRQYIQIGLDGQISNWYLADAEKLSLVYLDTSTPLFRINGKEQMNAELFLKSAPSFLRWLLKWLFLDEVVDRYYDLGLVLNDFIANFYKEQREDLIPETIDLINARLDEWNKNAAETIERSGVVPDYVLELLKNKMNGVIMNEKELDKRLSKYPGSQDSNGSQDSSHQHVTGGSPFLKLFQYIIPHFTIEEIKKYYNGDKQIWQIFQTSRRIDRWLQTKILRRKYDFYLPGKIKR